MSRVGLSPISIPQGVEVEIEGSEVVVRKDKKELRRCFSSATPIELKDGQLLVTRTSDNRTNRALHGLTRALLANMVEGVSNGFERILEIKGVGYNASQEGDKLKLQVGFSHIVEIPMPTGIKAVVEKNNLIHIQGIDKEIVGEVAARIRAIRPADPYKGKGIKYAEEKLHLKPGKAGKAAKG
jgi:large subunit ribosomal protein L6